MTNTTRLSILALIAALFLLSACGNPTPAPATPLPSDTPQPSPVLAEPVVQVTRAPDVLTAARGFLDAWVSEDYPTMYAMLASESQAAIDQEAFTKRYRDVMAEASVQTLEYQLYSPTTNPADARVGFGVNFHTALVGDLHAEYEMSFVRQDGGWRISWHEGLVLPQLAGGNKVVMEYSIPSRANIYDRNGELLVGVGEAVALGLRTGQLEDSQERSLLEAIWRATGIRPEALQPRIDAYRQNDWYLPVADLSVQDMNPFQASLSRFGGVYMQNFTSRYYYYGPYAGHVTGYASLFQAEEVEQFKRMGYNVFSGKVGRSGLELWGEPYLGGQRGGVLKLYGPNNEPLGELGSSTSQPSLDIATTIDAGLQVEVAKALGDFRGAIVVLERDTGRVLAMASAPLYNPNLFEPSNFNSQWAIGSVFDANSTPLNNRAVESQYPLGSVFKIITMAAALKSGVYTTESTYDCQYFFTELQGVTLHDWTWTRFQKDEKTQPSGMLTLPEGLMRSCNPWFYHIGLDLFNRGTGNLVSDLAREFGLGSPTGIEISEVAGIIPDAYSQMDGTNIAIGQGDVRVTPLQVARFIAALGNGGDLYQPQLVERIGPEWGPVHVFTPTVTAQLPLTEDMLGILKSAMLSVVDHPRGTANSVLGAFSRTYRVPIAGKTGTAESGTGDPHAWFAGYTDANREGKPDIAVVVLVENVGEGSEFAAPIFKRVMEVYFTGGARSVYPWESAVGVKKTPTPTPTITPIETPTPTPTETPTPSPEG